MCTGLTLTSHEGHHFLGRSMDIPQEFNQSVHFVPRNFAWKHVVDDEVAHTKYAVLGMASTINDCPMFADGLNEHGLMCAGLNFFGFACYEAAAIEGKFNISPSNLIFWILSEFKNLEEVRENLKDLNLVNLAPKGTFVPPLHWIVGDKTGNSIVVEKTATGLSVFDNPVGVLTNNPTFDWHLMNLNQYNGLSEITNPNQKWDKQTLHSFSQGSGSFGIPGDFTSPSRFIRAAFYRHHVKEIATEDESVNSFFHILNTCNVLKGAVISEDGQVDHTVYTTAMCGESGTYYYHTYNNQQITAVHLFNEDLNAPAMKTYPYRSKQMIDYEN
ncbi:MAG: choloylglycine hydrolase [Turicibacter sp.]